jgi:hypothetical protein
MRVECVTKSVNDIERHAAEVSLLKLVTFLLQGHADLVELRILHFLKNHQKNKTTGRLCLSGLEGSWLIYQIVYLPYYVFQPFCEVQK